MTLPLLNSTTYRFLDAVDITWISSVIANMVVHTFFYRDIVCQPFVESESEQNYFYQVQNCQHCCVLQHKYMIRIHHKQQNMVEDEQEGKEQKGQRKRMV